jgi:hypothetical protein
MPTTDYIILFVSHCAALHKQRELGDGREQGKNYLYCSNKTQNNKYLAQFMYQLMKSRGWRENFGVGVYCVTVYVKKSMLT